MWAGLAMESSDPEIRANYSKSMGHCPETADKSYRKDDDKARQHNRMKGKLMPAQLDLPEVEEPEDYEERREQLKRSALTSIKDKKEEIKKIRFQKTPRKFFNPNERAIIEAAFSHLTKVNLSKKEYEKAYDENEQFREMINNAQGDLDKEQIMFKVQNSYQALRKQKK